MNSMDNNLFIDLDDIAVDAVTVLSEEGSRGMPEFAASCIPYGLGPTPSGPCLCSCAIESD